MERHPPSRSESQDIANKQEFVEGQRKEIDVKDYAEVQSLGQVIKDLEFPFIKNQIITYAERHDPNNELAPKLRDMEERVFECLTSGRSFRDSQII